MPHLANSLGWKPSAAGPIQRELPLTSRPTPGTCVSPSVTTMAPRIQGIHERTPRVVMKRSTSKREPIHSAASATTASTVGRPKKIVLNSIGV